MKYEFERKQDTAGEPSIADMVRKSIDILKRDKNGYFLFVEGLLLQITCILFIRKKAKCVVVKSEVCIAGGRIDHAHHESTPKKAFHDTVAFDEAIQLAVNMTSRDDTLIVVTADHSHVMSIGGYPGRGNPIMGKRINEWPDRGICNNGMTLSTGLQDNDVEPALDGMPYTTIQYANSRVAGRINLTGVDTGKLSSIPRFSQ